jgi:formylmethanofuran dehydrogenase subunit E
LDELNEKDHEILWDKVQVPFDEIIKKWIEEMDDEKYEEEAEEEKEEPEQEPEENKCSSCGESEWESEYDERMGMEMVVCIKCGNYYYPEIG